MKFPPILQPGPKFVSGSSVSGRVVLTRDDGTIDEVPVWMFTGATIVDNDDGTATLTI